MAGESTPSAARRFESCSTRRGTFSFDEKGICDLEAKVLGSVFLRWSTWVSHSTDHEGDDRTYFAEFRSNRDAIIEALRDPTLVRKIVSGFKPVFVFQGPFELARRTPGGVSIPPSRLLLSVIVADDNGILTFYPATKYETVGELVYP